MALGHALGWVNTRILLTVVFYLLFTPVAWLMHLLKNDPLNRRYDAAASSYRVARSTRPAEHMRQQF
jgi:hypothetical protein